MMVEVDWDSFRVLVKDEGLLPKENKIYTLLMTGGFLPEKTFNTLALYNHDYSIIQTFQDWKLLVKNCKAGMPQGYSGWQHSSWNQQIATYALNFAEGKSFILDIMREAEKQPYQYLNVFNAHSFQNIVTNRLNFLSKIKEEEDLELLAIAARLNYAQKHMYEKIDDRIRNDFLIKLAKDKRIIHQLSQILPMITLDSKDEWDQIFKGKEAYEAQYIGVAYNMPFYEEIISNLFDSIISSEDSVSKKDAEMAQNHIYTYVSTCLTNKTEVNSIAFDVLKKIHKQVPVYMHEYIFSNLRKNKKVVDAAEFESYIKYLVKEETRAGVLKELVKVLPKKQLPWLLSSDFKTVKDAVKKKLKA